MSIKLVIAEDQRLFRQSLRLLLEQEPDLKVVGEATDGQEAFSVVTKAKPDIVLMDVDMPKLDGVTATRLIRERLPEVKVLMLSVHDDDLRIVAAVQAGACGYILKDADHKEFLHIIRGTYRGEPVASPFLADRLARKAATPRTRTTTGAWPRSPSGSMRSWHPPPPGSATRRSPTGCASRWIPSKPTCTTSIASSASADESKRSSSI